VAPTQLSSPEAAAHWLRQRVRANLRTDSRQLRPGDGFIAWPGHSTDGRLYVQAALRSGASACLVEREGVEAFAFDDARVATAVGLKAAAGAIADAYFDHPSHHLRVIAVTGTNGKSSVAWWTAQALTQLNRRCAVIGTLGIGQVPSADAPDGRIEFTGLTTPDPVTLHQALRRFVDAGFVACAIEASSIGIVEQRLVGTRVEVAQFTNFTREHLDYHPSMQAYWIAKRALFDAPGLKSVVVNVDDERGAMLAAELSAKRLDLWTTSLRVPARLAARTLRYIDGGLVFDLIEGEQCAPVRTALVGDYNASNLLAVVGALRASGVTLEDAARVVARLTPVPGRMQQVSAAQGADRGPMVVVDYAHTPDALDKALQALRPLAAARGGRLWCVFGCGGNRDPSKRRLMGAIAAQLADRTVVTSDNPRHEDAAAIVEQIVVEIAGRAGVEAIVERRRAIAHAVAQAADQDVILLAGKGHEPYQEIAGVKLPFSDVDEAANALRRRGRS
jgi:UDP-N-acetylmuramoyl-L-alanyl-D-glutamate--2,6-diaminopimelate ligase